MPRAGAIITNTSETSRKRNLLINGGLQFWQRDPSYLKSIGELVDYNSVDRFRVNTFNTAGVRQNNLQSSDVPNEIGSNYSGQLLWEGAGIFNESFDISQRIASNMVRRENVLASQRLSFSMWYKTDEMQEMRVRLLKASAQDNWGAPVSMFDQTYPITADSTWRKIVVSNMAIDADSYNGIELNVSGLNPINSSGQRFFRYAQLMLNEGSIAAPFALSTSSPILEFLECQQFYEKSYDVNVAIQTSTAVGVQQFRPSSGNLSDTIYFRSRKIATPVVTLINPVTNIAGNIRNDTAGTNGPATADNVSEASYSMNLAGVADGAQYSWHWTADAEL